MSITTIGAATRTAATAETGIATATLTGDCTILITCNALTPADAKARLVIEDSAIGDFTDVLPVAVFEFGPAAAGSGTVSVSERRYQSPTLRAGSAGNKLRSNLVLITGTSPSISYTASLIS